jgi:hypothetical protein
MGLGTFLLNGEPAIARLARGLPDAAPSPTGRPDLALAPAGHRAASRATTTKRPTSGVRAAEPMAAPSDQDVSQADYVLLWPALGCPGLIHPTQRTLDIVFLCRHDVGGVSIEVVQDFLHRVQVLNWDTARNPYLEAYANEASTTPQTIDAFDFAMAGIVPKVYKSKGFKTIVGLRVALNANTSLQKGSMHTLYYPAENDLLQDILSDSSLLEKPYDSVPVIKEGTTERIGGPNFLFQDRAAGQSRESRVRLFHPFWVAADWQTDYLNVGHLTDLHVSTLWDFIDKKLYPNAPRDHMDPVQGRTAAGSAAFPAIAERYNNPNLNMRSLTRQLNARTMSDQARFVDLILYTGDLIDFNRGFNHNPEHDPDRDYVYNLNWLRFYELLLLDYERPTFTALGNHDWHVNPYPPIIKAEFIHYLLFLLLGTANGTTSGAVFGALQTGNANHDEWPRRLFLSPLVAVPTTLLWWLLVPGFGFLLEQLGEHGWMWAAVAGSGYLLGLLVTALLIPLEGNKVHDAATGTLWGTLFGFLFYGLVFGIILAVLSIKYMTHIANLLGDDFKQLLGPNATYLTLFGKDGLFYAKECAYDWYALVINPFEEYCIKYGNMSFLNMNWYGSEVLPDEPPVADDAFSDRQWRLVNQWITAAVRRRNELTHAGLGELSKQVVPIIGLHTQVFCPDLDVKIADLKSKLFEIDDSDLARGTMSLHREDLISAMHQLGHGLYPGANGGKVPAISLTGHTHVADIVRMEGPDRIKWHETADVPAQTGEPWNLGLHVTTICSGPPGDGVKPADAGKGTRVMRAAGGRVLRFERDTGWIAGIEEITADTGKFGAS